MDYSRLINDFLDGTLDGPEEDELFSKLDESEELRNELKGQMAIKSAIKSDTRAFTPAHDSSSKIFAALGFAAATAVTAPAAPGIISRVLSFLGTYKQAALGVLAGAVAAASIIFSVLPGHEHIEAVNPAKALPAVSGYSSPQAAIASVYSQAARAAESAPLPATRERVIVKYVYVSRDGITTRGAAPAGTASGAASSGAAAAGDIASDEHESLKIIGQGLANNIAPGRGILTAGHSAGPVEALPLKLSLRGPNGLYSVSPAGLGLSIELSGAQYWFTSGGEANPDAPQTLNNTGITLLYDLGSDFKAGLDIRRENFYQKYDGTESLLGGEKGEKVYYAYEQQPNFTTTSMALRYSPEFASLGWFSPFVQTMLGVNKAGTAIRLMGGTELLGSSHFSFILGYDYSSLLFSHDGRSYNSSKTGVHVGASIKF